MWNFIVINLYFSIAKSAWVEIPQLTNKKPAQFVFGAPKVSFVQQKATTEKPVLTTPKLETTSLEKYKEVMTTSTVSTPLKTKSHSQKNEESPKENKQPNRDYSAEFMPILKNIQDTLVANAKKSLRGKISLLTGLKDNLLAEIDERMSSLWNKSDDVVSARGGHSDHDVDFPSNEGALMTIGFLTFAVFLIKLVLKLIHVLKAKQNNMMMMMTAAPPTVSFVGRKKRSLEEDIRILQLIEEYTFT